MNKQQQNQNERYQLQADPTHPTPVQGSDSGRAQGETAGEGTTSCEEKKTCECGCGEYPKNSSSRFLPGHSLKSHYKYHPEQDQQYDEMKDQEKFGGK